MTLKTLAEGAPLRVTGYYTDRNGKKHGPLRPLGRYFWAPDGHVSGPLPVWDRHGRQQFTICPSHPFYSDLVAEAEAPKRR